jgi:hypothetical protein
MAIFLIEIVAVCGCIRSNHARDHLAYRGNVYFSDKTDQKRSTDEEMVCYGQ